MSVRTIVRAKGSEAVDAEDDSTLLDVVQDVFELHAASKGCVDGQCGACRVLVNGQATNACRVLWKDVPEGTEILTYEDVSEDPAVVAAVAAFEDERPTRCSLCIGGLGVTAYSLVGRDKTGDPDAVEETLKTATCMCTGRGSLRRALLVALRR